MNKRTVRSEVTVLFNNYKSNGMYSMYRMYCSMCTVCTDRTASTVCTYVLRTRYTNYTQTYLTHIRISHQKQTLCLKRSRSPFDDFVLCATRGTDLSPDFRLTMIIPPHPMPGQPQTGPGGRAWKGWGDINNAFFILIPTWILILIFLILRLILQLILLLRSHGYAST